MSCLSLDLLRGVPFLDSSFRHASLLHAVAARRAWVLEARHRDEIPCDPRELLRPAVGRAIRRAEGLEAPIPHGPLKKEEERQARQVLDDLVAVEPGWRPLLLLLPLDLYSLLDGEAISCSSFAWPQSVFLRPDAFASADELREQILHEVCHNWLYLIQEVWRLHPYEHDRLYTLPSGTGGRNLSEVIGASHVAATLLHWYSRSPSDVAPLRRDKLGRYLAGSLQILAVAEPGHLTETGSWVASRLRVAAARLGVETVA